MTCTATTSLPVSAGRHRTPLEQERQLWGALSEQLYSPGTGRAREAVLNAPRQPPTSRHP